MIVCQCRSVSDREIRSEVAGGAVDLDAVARGCGAGARCGGCHHALARLLDELLDQSATTLVSVGA